MITFCIVMLMPLFNTKQDLFVRNHHKFAASAGINSICSTIDLVEEPISEEMRVD